MAVFRDYDQAALDRQYNNRAAAPDFPSFVERWPVESAAVRERLGGRFDLAYGPHERHRLDVFPAAPQGGAPAPALAFIHGGYWQSLDKGVFSFLAAPFVEAGVTFVALGYPICPAVGMDDISASIRTALAWLSRNLDRHGGDPERLHLTGHSAGGHLTALMMAEDWSAEPGVPADLLKSGTPISGLYDLEPIRLSYLNAALGMDAGTAQRNSPVELPPLDGARLTLAVGATETDEFRRQQADFAALAQEAGAAVESLEVPGRHHFSVLDALAEPGNILHQAVLRRIVGSG